MLRPSVVAPYPRTQILAVASAMAPPKKTKASSSYKGVRVRPSGRWSAELQHESVRYYLGTLDTADLVARAYDIVGWRLGVPREELNFPDITSLQDAIFVGPPMKNRVKTRLVKKKEEPTRVIETDDEAMARFAREHPEYVRYERGFF
ncbi:ap2-containing protein [Hordeum vulgare]|nr:ap2-containing protein [Hordeum vulgare]